MKRLSFIMALTAICISSFAQNYTIKGDVMDILKEKLEGKTIYITNPQSNRQIDSAKVVNGHFEFKGTEKGDSVCYIAFLANRHHFILQPGNILYDSKSGGFSGTPLNDIITQLKDELNTVRASMMDEYKLISADKSLTDKEKNAAAMRLY